MNAPDLLLGEWACLGVIDLAPSHGFAISQRLAPAGDIGRIWTLSRPLTYRALDRLVAKGCAMVAGEAPGTAGGPRTIFAPSKDGRARLAEWLGRPTEHLRDLRSELLLKLRLVELRRDDPTPLLQSQRAVCRHAVEVLHRPTGERDPVAIWRHESSLAALAFVERLLARQPAN